MTHKIDWGIPYVDTSKLAEERAKLDKSELSALLYGDFTPDEREIALHERLVKYYKDTPDSMSNRDALPYWKAFNKWCNGNGYTREEVNNAKRQCAHLAA
jgi:hypothetical protein